jgi:hypothetical protein
VIIVIIALSVACGYEYDFEYDFEYDWSRSRSSSPPKKEEVVSPKAQMVDPKMQVLIGNPKLPDGNYKYRFPSSTTTTPTPMEMFLKAAYDLIPENDRKKFGFLTIDEIHELKKFERELIFQSLKKKKLFMMIT